MIFVSPPFFLSIKSSTMPDCKGPGLNKATKAMMSSNLEGCILSIRSLIPGDSNWKIPIVLAEESRLNVFLSLRDIFLISIGESALKFINSTVFCMTVSVFKPKKSNFMRPIDSASSLSNWVTVPSSSSTLNNGIKSDRFDGAITTPPACVPAFLTKPSSLSDRSMMD